MRFASEEAVIKSVQVHRQVLVEARGDSTVQRKNKNLVAVLNDPELAWTGQPGAHHIVACQTIIGSRCRDTGLSEEASYLLF